MKLFKSILNLIQNFEIKIHSDSINSSFTWKAVDWGRLQYHKQSSIDIFKSSYTKHISNPHSRWILTLEFTEIPYSMNSSLHKKKFVLMKATKNSFRFSKTKSNSSKELRKILEQRSLYHNTWKNPQCVGLKKPSVLS